LSALGSIAEQTTKQSCHAPRLQTSRERAVKVFFPTFSKTATSNTLLPRITTWQPQ
jgi:hypothetical protein